MQCQQLWYTVHCITGLKMHVRLTGVKCVDMKEANRRKNKKKNLSTDRLPGRAMNIPQQECYVHQLLCLCLAL